jgi:hypothetical protein
MGTISPFTWAKLWGVIVGLQTDMVDAYLACSRITI